MAVTLVVSLGGVALIHDVHALASRSTSTRASLNLTFSSLARSLLVDEGIFGTNAAALMAQGPTLSRAQFAGQLSLLKVEGDQLVQRASLLQKPTLDYNVQSTLLTVTDLRVSSVEEILHAIQVNLAFPHPLGLSAAASAVQHALQRSDRLWVRARSDLRRSPGRARLVSSVFALSSTPLVSEVAAIEAAPSLQPVHAVTISAVAVTPAPFPAPRFRLVLPPVTSASINVVVSNTQFINQTISVRLSIAPRSNRDPAFSRSVTIVLGPLRARAVNFGALPLSPSERAVVTIQLTGAPIAVGGSGSRRYQLIVASAPAV